MTSSYLLQCFGTMCLFVLGAQFDTARTSRLLFHPPRTSCCVFLHLRTHPQILRLIPHQKRHVDTFYYGIALDLRHTICSAYPDNRTNVSVGRSGNSFRRNALQRWIFFAPSESHVIKSRIYFALCWGLRLLHRETSAQP